MQLYMLAPFVLHLLYKNPRLGALFSLSAVLVSCLIRAVYCTSYGICNKSDVDIPVSIDIYVSELSLI